MRVLGWCLKVGHGKFLHEITCAILYIILYISLFIFCDKILASLVTLSIELLSVTKGWPYCYLTGV